MVYYNENDPFAAAWLTELIKAGALPYGVVDDRSIAALSPMDLAGYTQCHFFAGIGGWAHALDLAHWGDRPVWTGSCPCQPYSAAGRQQGHNDSRDLWPIWFQLIRECRPPVVFGEQVEGAVRHGWLDRLCGDLEGEDYAVGATVLGAHSVGAPHIRQRLYFVAESQGTRGWANIGSIRTGADQGLRDTKGEDHRWSVVEAGRSLDSSAVSELAESQGEQHDRSEDTGERWGESPDSGKLGDTYGARLSQRKCDGRVQRETMGAFTGQTTFGGSATRGLVNTPSEQVGVSGRTRESRSPVADADGRQSSDRELQRSGKHMQRTENSATGFWRDVDWLPCRDGKLRPVEPGTFPLAHGVPARMGRLRGYGNAIVPQVAQVFIESYLEA